MMVHRAFDVTMLPFDRSTKICSAITPISVLSYFLLQLIHLCATLCLLVLADWHVAWAFILDLVNGVGKYFIGGANFFLCVWLLFSIHVSYCTLNWVRFDCGDFFFIECFISGFWFAGKWFLIDFLLFFIGCVFFLLNASIVWHRTF